MKFEPFHKKAIVGAMWWSSFMLGWLISSFGTIIPYLSRATHKDETSYSYIFIARCLGNIVSSMLAPHVGNAYPTQLVMRYIVILYALSIALTTVWLDTIPLFFWFFIDHVLITIITILGFTITLKLFAGQDPQFYMQLGGFIFGLGTITQPLLMPILGLSILKVLGLLSLPPLLVYAIYPLPDVRESKEQKKQQTHKKERNIDQKTQFFIALVMFFYCTIEIGFASWLPTYAIKAGLTDTEGSGFYSLLFWIPCAVGRLVWTFVPGTVHYKTRIIFKIQLFSAGLMVVLQLMGHYSAVCYCGGIISGFTLANMYALCLALPNSHGFVSTITNNAHIVMANCIGQGVLIAPIGYSITAIGFKSFIYFVAFFSVAIYLAFDQTQKCFQQLQSKEPASNQVQLLQRKVGQ